MKPIDYARHCCDTIMRKFDAPDLPPAPHFHYHAGVFLSGMERLFLLTGEEKYSEYIKKFLDTYVDDEGVLHHIQDESFDDLQACNLMYRFYDDEPRYRKVLDTHLPLFLKWRSNDLGGFWHKYNCPDQMWLDSLYMAGPLGVRYGLIKGDERYIDVIHTQLKLMWDNMRDENSGLLFHAWDYSKKASWVARENGCSAEIWGRALGWYVVASADISEMLGDNPKAAEFREHAVELVNALLKYQDEKTGLWYQVTDKGDCAGNWTETSCSCLFLYGLCNLIKRGILDKSYVKYADRAYNGIIENKTHLDGENLIISDICIGTGVGDYEHYINRPTTENDLHGTGAFVLMCTEYEKMKRSIGE